MQEEIIKINEHLTTIYKEMTSLQHQITAQNKAIQNLSSSFSANTNASIILFSWIINANPKSKDIIIESLNQTLEHLDKTDSKDKVFDSFLKNQLTEILKFLQSPPKHTYLRLVNNDNAEEG